MFLVNGHRVGHADKAEIPSCDEIDGNDCKEYGALVRCMIQG